MRDTERESQRDTRPGAGRAIPTSGAESRRRDPAPRALGTVVGGPSNAEQRHTGGSARQAVLVGAGAVGTPLSLCLLSLGVRRFVLFDPKRHKPENVQTQCSPEEVGQFKVKAAARRLRRAGAREVIAWPLFVEFAEPGWAGPDAFVVACGDRLAAVRAAHDLARSLRLPFFRLNIEPLYAVATLSCFDYRPERVASCALCGWNADHFARQEHAVSCAPSPERPTGSPRALSLLAASWGALTILRALDAASAPLWGRHYSLSALRPELLESISPGNPACRGSCHTHAGDFVRLEERPEHITFEWLCRRAGYDPTRARVLGSAAFALAARCHRCRQDVHGCWWMRALRPVDRCACGGRLHPLPFAALRTLQKRQIQAYWTRPLSTLRVPRKARLTLQEGETRCTHFIVG